MEGEGSSGTGWWKERCSGGMRGVAVGQGGGRRGVAVERGGGRTE